MKKMTIAIRRKILYVLAAAALALMLAGASITAPALADCVTVNSTVCSG
jgi:hypothetical protein